MLKTAVLAPIPNARIATTAARNHGFLHTRRMACTKSRVTAGLDTSRRAFVPRHLCSASAGLHHLHELQYGGPISRRADGGKLRIEVRVGQLGAPHAVWN